MNMVGYNRNRNTYVVYILFLSITMTWGKYIIQKTDESFQINFDIEHHGVVKRVKTCNYN